MSVWKELERTITEVGPEILAQRRLDFPHMGHETLHIVNITIPNVMVPKLTTPGFLILAGNHHPIPSVTTLRFGQGSDGAFVPLEAVYTRFPNSSTAHARSEDIPIWPPQLAEGWLDPFTVDAIVKSIQSLADTNSGS